MKILMSTGGRIIAVLAALLGTCAVARAQSSAVDGFNPGANNQIRAVAVQANGKIVVAGDFTMLGGGGTGTTPRNHIGRLNADGSLDASFDPGANFPVLALAIQPDGKILVGGRFSFFGGGGTGTNLIINVARLNDDGTLDTSFDFSVPSTFEGVNALAVQPDGKILIGGKFTWQDSGTGATARNIGRLNADGSPDGSFDPGANDRVMTLAVQPDAKILVGGWFTTLGGGGTGTTARNRIGRLNADGSLDTSFNPGANNPVFSVALQADMKIVLGGSFTTLGGGGTGTTGRSLIGRLHGDGSLDMSFNPGAGCSTGFCTSVIFSLALQPDGKILVGGTFRTLGGGGTGTTSRHNLGRIHPNGSLDLTFNPGAGGVFLPSVNALAVQPDLKILVGGTFATLGGGGTASVTRHNLGRLHAVVTAAPLTELVSNGTFSSGSTSWLFYATPDLSYIVSSVTGGVLQFHRQPPPPGTSNQAVAFQETGAALGEHTPLAAQFDLGNSSSVRKRISVLILDSNFSDLSVCTFWLAPNAPLRRYGMRTHTTHLWTNAAIYFYAATAGSDGGHYLVDNVSMQHDPAQSSERTDCLDPTVPAPPGGAASADLVTNGSFSGGQLAPWGVFGQIVHQIFLGIFEFYRPPGTPAGVVLQGTGQAMTASQILTSTFQLGNSSFVRKRVTVLLHDGDFGDLSACTFWLAPYQGSLSSYMMRSFTTKSWTNATVSIYAATIGVEPWIRLDNVSLQRTPASAILGTECIEPAGGNAPVTASRVIAARPARDQAPVRATLDDGARDWVATEGFALHADADVGRTGLGWRAVASATETQVLRWARSLDLREATNARLSVQSWLSARSSSAAVQVSVDGMSWQTVAAVPSTEEWVDVEIDLSAFAGQVVQVRFVYDAVAPADGAAPDVWRLDDVRLVVLSQTPNAVVSQRD